MKPELSTVSPQINSLASPDWFGSFWALYPRREARKDAIRAWSKISESDYAVILEALVQWRNVWRQQNRSTNMIPLPATWLNGERWTDEVPAELTQVIAAQQVPRETIPFIRGIIPAAAQRVLDQLKSKR